MATKKKRARVRKPRQAASSAPAESAAVDINTGVPVVTFGTPYGRMVDVMKQLAHRDNKHEAAVMRIANAGGIKEVIEYIKMMRMYQKKHKK